MDNDNENVAPSENGAPEKVTLTRLRSNEGEKENNGIDAAAAPAEKDKSPGVEMTNQELKEFYLEDTPTLLAKACEPVKGQKKLIKKLYSDYTDVIMQCTVNQLRRTIWTASFVSSPEGRKFCARAVSKIKPRGVCLLMKKSVIVGGATNSTCNHYGEIIYLAWKYADKEEDEELRGEIETQLITGVMHAGIFLEDPFSAKFRQMLSYFPANPTIKTAMDNTLYNCFLPVIWRGMAAINWKVRYNAALLVLDFYPLVPDDDCERVEVLEKLNEFLEKCLLDDCTVIRHQAIKKVLHILATFWNYIPSQWRKKYFVIVCDKLSRDADPGTRFAVYEGLMQLLNVPACMNSTEHALRICCPKGIDDKNERIRIKAFELLKGLRNHRYIKFFDVVDVDHVCARLEIETSEEVRKEIVQVIFRTFFPSKTEPKERINRALKLIEYGRIAALTFHRLMFKLNLITVGDALQHCGFICLAVKQSAAKGFTVQPGAELGDETMSFNDTIGSLSGSDQQDIPPPDENNIIWRRCKVLLECFIVLWLSMKRTLDEEQYAVEKAKLENIGKYMFKKMFQNYRDTSLIGTTMSLGSLLPANAMDGITTSVLKLLNEKVVDDSILEPYLDAIATWKMTHILDRISSGLDELKTCTTIGSPMRKKSKKADSISPEDNLRKAITYLKFMLRTYHVRRNLLYDYEMHLLEFHKQLGMLRGVVDQRLGDEPLINLSDELLTEAFNVHFALSAILLNTADEDNSEHVVFVRDLCDCLRWFEADVIAKMQLFSADPARLQFLCDFSEVLLRNICLVLMTWDFSSLPTSSQLPSFVKSQPGNDSADNSQNNSLDFLELCMRVVAQFCSSSTPAVLMPNVISAAKQLLDVQDEFFSAVYTIFDFIPKWIIKCHEAEDEMDQKRVSEAYSQLWKIVSENEECSSAKIERTVSKMATLLLDYLVNMNEEKHDIGDPRNHDFERPAPIEILVHKVVLKNPQLSKMYLECLGGLFMKSQLVSDEIDADLCLIRLGSCAQLAFLSDVGTMGISRIGKSTSAVTRCSEEVKSLLSVLATRVKEVEERERRPVDDFIILSQVKELLDM